MQYIVALTGGIGSGKSTVAKIFSYFNIPLIDADIIARNITSPGSPVLLTIKRYFGPRVLNIDGSLNRYLLRRLIFNNNLKKDWLSNLLHPLIQYQTTLQLQSFHMPYVLWIVPLLFENNLQQFANRVLVVDTDPDIQIKRIQNRDFIDQVQVKNILDKQVSRQYRLSYADDIINNQYCYTTIIPQVIYLHHKYLMLATL